MGRFPKSENVQKPRITCCHIGICTLLSPNASLGFQAAEQWSQIWQGSIQKMALLFFCFAPSSYSE